MKYKSNNYRKFLSALLTICILSIFPADARAAIGVSSIAPQVISNLHENTLTITGTDFSPGAVVTLKEYGILTSSYFSSTTIFTAVPAGIPDGVYSVTVTNPDSTFSSLTGALTVISQIPAETETSTPQPPGGYERPVIVVNTYSISQDKVSPGDYFILYVTLYNAGQYYARNIVANFTPGDLIPRETGGVVAVGEIAPGNRLEFAQPFVLSTEAWSSVASTSMVVTYADDSGILYSGTFAVTVPVYHSYAPSKTSTPTPTLSPTPAVKPQLVITSYTTDISPLQPGIQFNLQMTIKNMGNSTARRVTMIVGGGSGNSSGDSGTQQPGGISGGSGEFSNFAPIGSSNVQSLGEFVPDSILSASQSLIVNVSTTPGAYPLKISFVYADDQNRTFTDDQVITLLVYRMPILDINFYQQVSALYAGQPSPLPLQVVNLSRTSIVLGNMRVSADSGIFGNNSILVGTLESGGYFTLDASFTPDQPGAVDLIVSIDYTNDFNQPQVITKTLTVDVLEQPIVEPPVDGGQSGGIDQIPQQPETFLQKIWRFILGLLGLDSGISTQASPTNLQPIETGSPEKNPIEVPVNPPLKGP